MPKERERNKENKGNGGASSKQGVQKLKRKDWA